MHSIDSGPEQRKDYDDSSSDYSTGSASGSNWSGSSGIDDDGEEANEYNCYCYKE